MESSNDQLPKGVFFVQLWSLFLPVIPRIQSNEIDLQKLQLASDFWLGWAILINHIELSISSMIKKGFNLDHSLGFKL
jgi:hypothetical protein